MDEKGVVLDEWSVADCRLGALQLAREARSSHRLVLTAIPRAVRDSRDQGLSKTMLFVSIGAVFQEI